MCTAVVDELFHIHFTSFHSSGEDMNLSLPMCGFIAQLVNCLSWKIYGDDHSSLSSDITVVKKKITEVQG